MTTSVPSSGPQPAPILIVAEAPGKDEESGVYPDWQPGPFLGAAGRELTSMLSEAGISRDACRITNVFLTRPRDTSRKTNDAAASFFHSAAEAKKLGLLPSRGLFPNPLAAAGLERLRSEIAATRPHTIIAFGNYALWALCDEDCFTVKTQRGWKEPTGIGLFAGSMLYLREDWSASLGFKPKVLPTTHPAAILRQWSWRPAAIQDLRRVVKWANSPTWPDPAYDFTVAPDLDTTLYRLRELRSAPALSVDLETSGEVIDCIGLADSASRAICIPFAIPDERKEFMTSYWPAPAESRIKRELRSLLANPALRLIGQNYNYDAQYIAGEFILLRPATFDTMVCHHLTFPGFPRGLDYLSRLYASYHRYWKGESKHRDPHHTLERHWQYNCKDAAITFEVAEVIAANIEMLGLDEQAAFQMSRVHSALHTMIRGIKVDRDRKAAILLELSAAAESRAAWLEDRIPEALYPRNPKLSPWYRSNKQTAEIFYDELGLKEQRKRGRPGENSSRTVDNAALDRLKLIEPLFKPIFQTLQEYRSLEQFHGILSARLDPDHRMRCSFDVSGTETFRFSSSENAFGRGTNLQTIPRGLSEDEVEV